MSCTCPAIHSTTGCPVHNPVRFAPWPVTWSTTVPEWVHMADVPPTDEEPMNCWDPTSDRYSGWGQRSVDRDDSRGLWVGCLDARDGTRGGVRSRSVDGMTADLRRLLASLTEGCEPGPWHGVESGDKAAFGWWLENPVGDSSFPEPDDVALMLDALPALLAVIDAARYLIEVGCWGHAGHSSDICAAGKLRAAIDKLEPDHD